MFREHARYEEWEHVKGDRDNLSLGVTGGNGDESGRAGAEEQEVVVRAPPNVLVVHDAVCVKVGEEKVMSG